MLRCSLGFERRISLRSDGPCWSSSEATPRTKQVCVQGGRFSAHVPQSSAVVSLKPVFRQSCISWCKSCHGTERRAGWKMLGVAWTQVSPRSTEANESWNLPRLTRPTWNPAKTTNSSHRTVCCRKSPRTTLAKGFFTTGQAFKGIFCMDQTGFACAGLRQNSRSSRFLSSLLFLHAARAGVSDQGSPPRPAGPSAS